MAAVTQPDLRSAADIQYNPFFLAVLGGVQVFRALGQLRDALNSTQRRQEQEIILRKAPLHRHEPAGDGSASHLLKPATTDMDSPEAPATRTSPHSQSLTNSVVPLSYLDRRDFGNSVNDSAPAQSTSRCGSDHLRPHLDSHHRHPRRGDACCELGCHAFHEEEQYPQLQPLPHWEALVALYSSLFTASDSLSRPPAPAPHLVPASPQPFTTPTHHHYRHHYHHNLGGLGHRLEPGLRVHGPSRYVPATSEALRSHRNQALNGSGSRSSRRRRSDRHWERRRSSALVANAVVQPDVQLKQQQQQAAAVEVAVLPDATSWLQAATVCAGAACRTLAQVVIHPLDTIKTRMQVRMASPQLQIWRAAMSCPATRPRALAAWMGPAGLRDVFLGLGAAVAGTLPASALYFGAEQMLRGLLAETLQSDRDAPPCRLAASAAAATLSALIRVPADVLKHRVQSYAFPNVTAAARSILSARGPAGLYAGFGATLLRDAPEIVVQFTLYGQLKALMEAARQRQAQSPNRTPTRSAAAMSHGGDVDGNLGRLHVTTAAAGAAGGASAIEPMLLGGAAGAVAALATTPLDVVKTQLQCGAASSVTAALAQVVRSGGPGALFGGVGPRVLQTALCSAIFFTCFEASKAKLGELAACGGHGCSATAAAALLHCKSPPEEIAVAAAPLPPKSPLGLSPGEAPERPLPSHPFVIAKVQAPAQLPLMDTQAASRLQGWLAASYSYGCSLSSPRSFSSSSSNSDSGGSCSASGSPRSSGAGAAWEAPVWDEAERGRRLAPVAVYAQTYFTRGPAPGGLVLSTAGS